LIKIINKEENFKWHLEAFASELFIYCLGKYKSIKTSYGRMHLVCCDKWFFSWQEKYSL